MSPFFRHQVLEELRCQCRFGLHAYEQVIGHLPLNDPQAVFFYAHALVRHSLDLGRMLWPTDPAAAERGAMLREAVGAPAQPPPDWQGFAAVADHFDTHLIAWCGNESHRDAQPMNVMPVGPLGGFPTDRFHRSLDPDSMQFLFEGQAVNLRQMADVIRNVGSGAERWLRRNSTP